MSVEDDIIEQNIIVQYINERIKKLEKTESEFGEHYWALRELKRLKEII